MSARGLVCVASAVSWLHPLFQRPHQLALAFARRGFEVVYVEPGLVVEGVPERVEVGAAQIELWRFREELAPPYYHWLIDRSQRAIWKLRALLDPLGVREWYNASFRPWLRTRLRERLLAERLARHPGPRRLLLLEYPATGFDRVVGRARREGLSVVYDRLDDFQALDGAPDRAAVELRLLRSADLVLATAERLEPAARPHARHLVRVPNGVDPEHFRSARTRPPLPDGWPFPDDGAPVVGYAGAVWDWFDVATVLGAARARPGWRFVLVGLSRPELRARLEAAANVRVVDAVSFTELPAWLGRFDVATVPFVDNAITRATNPVKVYEYLAAGRPVVAADLPELRGLPGVEIAVGPDAFVAAVERALQAPLELARIDAFLAANTWEKRVDAILAALGFAA